MTPEAQRIAIAEACGWTPTNCQAKDMKSTVPFWYKDGQYRQNDCLPDYLNDLDAMHEAEKVLNPPPSDREQDRAHDSETWHSYCRHLANVCPMGTYIRATAAQRAEAFLRTLNLWTE